ncbi:MAG TPA: hypothetical protein VES19_08795 [Candidatus Limnocylindrales bacterium]|nr:hypothetical protein [Candidatus Limnocylindrales bacterium]
MSTSTPFAPGPTFIPRQDGQHAATLLLASALSHLLNRDEERPARWLGTTFASDVELARRPLRQVVRVRDLPAPATGVPATFGSAVAVLGRDPASVALAVRRLEIARSASLPSWEDLVRRGLPPTVSPLDVATWFG